MAFQFSASINPFYMLQSCIFDMIQIKNNNAKYISESYKYTTDIFDPKLFTKLFPTWRINVPRLQFQFTAPFHFITNKIIPAMIHSTMEYYFQ